MEQNYRVVRYSGFVGTLLDKNIYNLILKQNQICLQPE